MSILKTISYKTRQNKIYYDMEIFSNFTVNLFSYISNALFGASVIILIYVFIVYKTQKVVKILLPIEENELIKAFICTAFVLKAFKICYTLWKQINVDIFFIDWERPRIFENTILGTTKSHLDTPSMCSSVSFFFLIIYLLIVHCSSPERVGRNWAGFLIKLRDKGIWNGIGMRL